jgi:hypothetical protein
MCRGSRRRLLIVLQCFATASAAETERARAHVTKTAPAQAKARPQTCDYHIHRCARGIQGNQWRAQADEDEAPEQAATIATTIVVGTPVGPVPPRTCCLNVRYTRSDPILLIENQEVEVEVPKHPEKWLFAMPEGHEIAWLLAFVAIIVLLRQVWKDPHSSVFNLFFSWFKEPVGTAHAYRQF